MSRTVGRNLSEAEREILGDRALALHLGGARYREIAAKIGVSKNTVGPLLKAALKRRSRDRNLEAELGRAIAIKRELRADLWNRMRFLPESRTAAAHAHARLAEQFRKLQLELLFLSGVEIPDPEKIILDAMADMALPMPDLTEYLSRADGVPGSMERSGMYGDAPDLDDFYTELDDSF